jgi:uncharacterized protein YjfI (DUF2170 family)
MADKDRWTLPSLVEALAASGVEVTVPDGGVHAAVLGLPAHPGLTIVAGVDGGEIQVGVLLERVSAVPDRPAFDSALLKANKLMTLSCFGITEVDGEAWYEVFGQMSSASDLEEVREELEALAANAADALEMIVDWEKEHGR